MLKIAQVPVKTRLPLEAWALAAAVTLFSVMSSLLHLSDGNRGIPRAEQAVQPAPAAHQAKV